MLLSIRNTDSLFPIKVVNLKPNNTERFYTGNIHSWSGTTFPVPENELENGTVKRGRRKRTPDQLEVGSIVFVDNIHVLYSYLQGTPRRPFTYPRNNYLLVLSHVAESYKEDVENVLHILWRDYGIMNLVLITPCGVKKVYGVIEFKFVQ